MTSLSCSKPSTNEAINTLATDSGGPDCQLRLWIGGLPARTTEYAVLQLIRQFGPLTDFSFPVHRYGELQGSTVGYCFVTYKDEKSASSALKSLNGLNFHGHHLVIRRAHPTRDELTLSQQACEEETRMRIIEETQLREAQLAARLAASTGTLSVGSTVLSQNISASRFATSSSFGASDNPELCSNYYNKASLPAVGTTYQPTVTEKKRPTSQAAKAIAIQRIESALHRLNNTPVGGASMLQPCSLTHPRPLIPPGLLANSTGGASHSSNSQHSRRGLRKTRDVRPPPRRCRR